MQTVFRALLVSLLLAPGAALAHTGTGAEHGFVHGLLHPLGGADHVLAMVAVGLLAAHLGGRALWLVPAAFVAAMAAGGWLGFSGAPLPYFEAGIALSVVVLGALVALRIELPLALAMTVAALFAVFHGYAHGAELPGGASTLAYGAGFVIATAILHATGIALGIGTRLLGAGTGARLTQAGGGAMAIAGLLLLARAVTA